MGPACPQQAITLPLPDGIAADIVDVLIKTLYGVIFPDDEDCLTINVVRPAGISLDAKLPVVAWIFGGGFELGSPQMYDGATIVSRSIKLNEPVIYVSMSYRVTAFGFLASQEVKDAGVGKLGLQDQRRCERYSAGASFSIIGNIDIDIGAFGGDPEKVTIWGESAGAISVALHMLNNGGDTEGLFRAGFMQSGSPIPVGDITNGQKCTYYDALVDQTGCLGSEDTLQCLREVPYDQLKDAVNNSPNIFSYQSLNLAWLPRADGVFLSDNPQNWFNKARLQRFPSLLFPKGDCDDEGTLFSFSTLNVT
ncbi:hypothetical protein D9758_014744 [Tetrapyrgos nigripes]|uniref:Carboxylic ester hydrolase n=1 Tax=Tetrapyrgos nigripes TaxID=182062 RepID=A0A8H5CGQ7_9AGAR|nr:hypothetical protein D9758_014744 [Tetrapyrgos nigripes]